MLLFYIFPFIDFPTQHGIYANVLSEHAGETLFSNIFIIF